MTGGNFVNYASGSYRQKSNRFRYAVQGIASFFILFLGIAMYAQRHLESDLSGNWFFAIVSGGIYSVVGFPVLVIVSFFMGALLRRLLKRHLHLLLSSPFTLPTAAGAILICISLFQCRSQSSLFRECLGINAPPSVTNLRYWWGTLPGDSEFVLRFKIASSDFPKILTCQTFSQVTDSSEIQDDLNDVMMSDRNRPRLAPPTPIAIYYKFDSGYQAGNHIVRIFATADRSDVLIYGDN